MGAKRHKRTRIVQTASGPVRMKKHTKSWRSTGRFGSYNRKKQAEAHNLQYEFIKLAEEAGIDAEQAGQRTQTKVEVLQKMISGEITGDILNG